MHPEIGHFILEVKGLYPQFFKDSRVLEVGSRNVNGTVREFFDSWASYLGIDCTDGKDVDRVCLAHEMPKSEQFDMVISCECFEHDPYYKKSIPHVLSLLRPGGLFVATWASPSRQEHGTTASGTEVFGPDANYYRGLSCKDFTDCLNEVLNPLTVQLARLGFDVYAHGLKVHSSPK